MDNRVILRLLELLRQPVGAGRFPRRDLVRLAVGAIRHETTAPWVLHPKTCEIWSERAIGRRCTCALDDAVARAAAREAELWTALGEPSDDALSLAALTATMDEPKAWQRRGRRRR